ncbi:MAG: zinc transporter ZupT [Candidatus Bipolaricaulota bacterium]
MSNLGLAFGLTAFAGLATGIGGLISFFANRRNYRFLSVSIGFSVGVMLYISFVEILPEGYEALAEAFAPRTADWAAVAAFFGGIALIGLIDLLVPAGENLHEFPSADDVNVLRTARSNRTSGPTTGPGHEAKLMRMGLFTALAIAMHNFPEGLVTFLSTLQDPTLGVAIAIAIALHNIPEGISVAVPIYYATGSRNKALVYSVLSGIAEPVGAGMAYLALRLAFGGEPGAFPPHVMGVLFAGVAGVMVYISLDELLPTSHAYGKGHDSIVGLIVGMAVMALSLVLLG